MSADFENASGIRDFGSVRVFGHDGRTRQGSRAARLIASRPIVWDEFQTVAPSFNDRFLVRAFVDVGMLHHYNLELRRDLVDNVEHETKHARHSFSIILANRGHCTVNIRLWREVNLRQLV